VKRTFIALTFFSGDKRATFNKIGITPKQQRFQYIVLLQINCMCGHSYESCSVNIEVEDSIGEGSLKAVREDSLKAVGEDSLKASSSISP
jgi:hypothetical protein